ncbi:MAG: M20 family metallopeptidase [Pseudomonadota bacterium]
MTNPLLAEAWSLNDEVVRLRRRIHQFPELGNHLPLTRAAVLESLNGLDIDVHLSNATSGVVAIMRGAHSGPTLLLRGDMDALPMPEHTGLSFASEHEGCMHACGHDAHTAMLTGAVKLLARRRSELHGNVVFMFQPGEEGPGGAGPMIEEGLLDVAGKADAAFAIHIFPNLTAGHVMTRPGPMLASADTVTIRIIGKGGHGSMPYDALDPVPVACTLVNELQNFVTRRFSVFDPVVITVGRIVAGTVDNVIPEHAEMGITLRTFSAEAKTTAHAGIRRIAEHIAAAYEMRAEVDIGNGYPATINDAQFVERFGAIARSVVGDDGYAETEHPLMAAEDFSLVLQRSPGCMAMLGTAPDDIDPADAPACHSTRMSLNEQALPVGVALHAAVALDYLSAPD